MSYADWAENNVIKADGSLAEAEDASGFLPTQRVYRSNTVGGFLHNPARRNWRYAGEFNQRG